MIYCYTGNGKGKTTAALGLALRASGYGMKTLILQFMKGTWHTGEIDAVKALPHVELVQAGKGFYKIMDDHFSEEEHRQAAEEGLRILSEKIASREYDVIILDEINVVIDSKLLGEEAIIHVLKKAPSEMHFVLTGRNASSKIQEIADLVTEMREIKHPFERGIQAQKGLDF